MYSPSIAAVLIVKNASLDLANCLDSVKDWVNEIVILDSGSNDNTKEIALTYTSKFYENVEWQGFGIQRQLAQKYVSSDYVLWLDADEKVTPELKHSILSVIQSEQDATLYSINRLNYVFGHAIKHSGWYPDNVIRLYKNAYTHYDDSLVHEKVIIPENANVVCLQGDIIHFPYKNVQQYLQKSLFYANEWSEQRKYKGKTSIVSACTHSLFSFIKMYILKRGFLDGKAGFVIALLSSISVFSKYIMLWDKTRQN